MSALVIIALIGVSVTALSLWAERRWKQTGEFFEEEDKDRSKFNDGDWLGPSHM